MLAALRTSGQAMPIKHSLIAATALVHGMTVGGVPTRLDDDRRARAGETQPSVHAVVWRSKMSCAPSGAFANANRPSAPTTTDIPVPLPATLTPAGLAFDIPEAMTICPDTPPHRSHL